MPQRSTTPDLNKQISHAPRSQNTKTLPDRCILSLSSTRESHPGGRTDTKKNPFIFCPSANKSDNGTEHPKHHPRHAEKKILCSRERRTKRREVKVAHTIRRRRRRRYARVRAAGRTRKIRARATTHSTHLRGCRSIPRAAVRLRQRPP
jgi:hypothetical protein